MVNKNDDCSQGTDSDRCRMGWMDQPQGTWEDESHLSFFLCSAILLAALCPVLKVLSNPAVASVGDLLGLQEKATYITKHYPRCPKVCAHVGPSSSNHYCHSYDQLSLFSQQ